MRVVDEATRREKRERLGPITHIGGNREPLRRLQLLTDAPLAQHVASVEHRHVDRGIGGGRGGNGHQSASVPDEAVPFGYLLFSRSTY